MTHNSRCDSATTPPSKCKCSCGGTLHGGGNFQEKNKPDYKEKKNQEEYSTKNLAQTTLKSLSYITPEFQIIYTSYKIINTGLQLYNIYNNLPAQKEFSKEDIKNLIIKGVSEGAKQISEPTATIIAKQITGKAKEEKILDKISKKTNVNEDIYSSMLEGTFKEQMLSGVKNLTSYTLEGII